MSQPYDRVFNFSAGPCTLPVSVLEEVRDDLLNWKGSGMSVMEMSHRGKHFEGIVAAAEARLRALMGIPNAYKVLFLQGGASLQNTMAPMNLLAGGSADYVVTGAWSKKSFEMGSLVGGAKCVWDGKANNYSSLPDLGSLEYSAGAAYVHFTTNETIHGVQFHGDPKLRATVVCDMSSDIVSRPVDVSRYAMIYAGAQKNMGPAGATVVIIHEDLLARTPEKFHPMLDYRLQAENGSLYNTPPCFSIYVCGLVYKWIQDLGGLSAIQAINERKAKAIYDAVDANSGFYQAHAQPEARSQMNVTFRLPSDELTDAFVKEAKALKLDGLKGHRSVGGIRASIYNAFPEEGCKVLAAFMKEFAAKNG
ncbi:MAG: 3-phosphoserine/phosphohydroxythreonine transaminase [Armatimonadetes bacterium]|nr:3-phosphoserine/phosphohydroxythreonine transaminase [Armatimonadota bacterium]